MTDRTPDPSLISYTHIIYALHALSVVIALTSAASVIGSFIFGLPSIVAVVMNYMRRKDAVGTWIDSHFRWQIRTFWGAAWSTLLVGILSAPLVLAFGLGILTFFVGIVMGDQPFNLGSTFSRIASSNQGVSLPFQGIAMVCTRIRNFVKAAFLL